MAETLLATTPVLGLISAFLQSNIAGKLIVFVLLICSLVAWTVMVGKYYDLSRLRSQNRRLERQLGEAEVILQLDPQLRRQSSGPYSRLMQNALSAYYRIYEGNVTTESRLAHVENALQRAVAAETIRYESKMVVLSSIVTGAPFLGLLGTVWGVMDAFGSIANDAGATIQSLAPGVAGALVTTVAGLLVAIPSVFGYNFLLGQVKILITEMENFASSLADRLEIEAREQESAND